MIGAPAAFECGAGMLVRNSTVVEIAPPVDISSVALRYHGAGL